MTKQAAAKLIGLALQEKRLGYKLSNNPNEIMPKGVKSITIHQTDNTDQGAGAEQHHKFMSNGSGGGEVSWHYTVDEVGAIQSFRDDRITWHCANEVGNESSIGIELCVDADKKGEPMMGEANYKKTLDNAAKLVALLMEEHNLGLHDIKQHFDWNGKNCPSYLRKGQYAITWKMLLYKVAEFYDILVNPPAKKLFRVSVTSVSTREAADKVKAELIAKGYSDTFITIVEVK